MKLFAGRKQRLTLVAFLLYFVIVGVVQPVIAQVSPSIFSTWFIPEYALTDRSNIAVYFAQFSVFFLSVISTILLFDHFISCKSIKTLNILDACDCEVTNYGKYMMFLLAIIVIIDTSFKKLIGYGAGKIAIISHPGPIVILLSILEIFISLIVISGAHNSNQRYLYAFITAVLSAMPSIISGSRGVLIYRLAAYLLAVCFIEGGIEVTKRRVAGLLLAAIIALLSLYIGNYARYGKLLDLGYVFYRFTGYADGINAITIYQRDMLAVDNGLTIGKYFSVLFHRSIEGVIRLYTSLCFDEVVQKYRYDVNLHNQALPCFSAWFLYFQWIGLVIGGIIEAFFLCLAEFLMKHTNKTIAFVGAYIYISVFLGIIIDGNIDGWIMVMIPAIGVLVLAFLFRLIGDRMTKKGLD